MRFTGKISYVTKNGDLYARGNYRENGKPKQVWRKVGGNKAAAKIAVIEEIERRLAPVVVKEKTFRDLCYYYREHHCVPAVFLEDVKIRGKKTYKIMLLDVGLLEKFFGDKLLKEITRDDIQRYKIEALAEPVRRVRAGQVYYKQRALATVHHHLRTLRSMLGVADAERWIDRIPSFRQIVSTASEVRRENIPTPEEFERLLEACNARERLFHVRPVMLMVADVGARPIEIWNLLWSDLNLEEGWVILTSDKGKRRVKTKMYLTPRLIESLSQLPKLNEYVFGGIKSIKKAWYSIVKLSGVDVHLYSLRHFYGSQLKANGYDAMDIMMMMRHTKLATTNIYIHMSDEKKKEMTASLQQL